MIMEDEIENFSLLEWCCCLLCEVMEVDDL